MGANFVGIKLYESHGPLLVTKVLTMKWVICNLYKLDKLSCVYLWMWVVCVFAAFINNTDICYANENVIVKFSELVSLFIFGAWVQTLCSSKYFSHSVIHSFPDRFYRCHVVEQNYSSCGLGTQIYCCNRPNVCEKTICEYIRVINQCPQWVQLHKDWVTV